MAGKNLRIGLIGIGNMGNPMGGNLIKNRFRENLLGQKAFD